ncbi:MAG: hypothetical protein RR086_03360 [Clostridia bacterium]
MNILYLVLFFVVFKMFNGGDKNTSDTKSSFDSLSSLGILGDNGKDIINSINKLNDPQSNKQNVILEIITNPAVFSLAQEMFFHKKNTKTEDNESDKGSAERRDTPNSKPQEEQGFSEESKEFFKPITNVAGKEISEKLYSLYDNWYIT